MDRHINELKRYGWWLMRIKLSSILIGFIVLLGAFPGLAKADSITLRDGRHVQGKFAGGTQGVIAFSVGGTTQYYEVSNILVMTFEGEGSDAQGSSRQQASPIIPESGSIVPQHHQLHRKSNSAAVQVITDKSKPKQSVRLLPVVQRSE